MNEVIHDQVGDSRQVGAPGLLWKVQISSDPHFFLLLVLKIRGHIVLTLHQPQGDAGAAEQQNFFLFISGDI